MTHKPEIFAVVWRDFIPLSLRYGSAPEAITEAAKMRAHMMAKGFADTASTVRAVHMPAGSDCVTFLDGEA